MSSVPSAVAEAPNGAARRRRFTVDSLFVDNRPQAVGVTDLATAKEIRLDRITADPDQPRHSFDAAKLEELAASIRTEGVLQPIVVRYEPERDIYVIVHGERRWRASQAAELTTIPAIVREVPESRRLIHQLMENIVRDDLNAIDRAAALRVLKIQLDDAPWDAVAEAVGIRRSRLFQLLGTEKLPERFQDDIRNGRLSEKQSRALQGLAPGHQDALRDEIVEHDLPADEAIRIARALKAEAVPDDVLLAKAAIIRLRTPAVVSARRDDDELTVLLSAIIEASTGGSVERGALRRMADERELPTFDPESLRSDVVALARTLARVPADELRPGTQVYATLAALYGALDAALPTSL